jgi:hypothetical protein
MQAHRHQGEPMTELDTDTRRPARASASPAQWAVILVAVLAAWEVGRLVARWLMALLAPGWAWVSTTGTGVDVFALVTLIGQVVLSAVIAAPLAFLAARLVTRSR